MTNEEEMDDELRSRRAAVFRRVREEQRQVVRDYHRRQELGIPPDVPMPTSSASASKWSLIVGTLGSVMVLRFTPALSLAFDVPEALAFAGTGGVLGVVFGVTRDADSWESRVEHALAFGAVFGFAFGVLSLL